jgi:murein DD-endopeptidase MepM/ murein hydrolase activator NlpD
MKKQHWYFAGAALLTILIMGTNKAFGNITNNQKARGCDVGGWGCGSFGASRGDRKHNGLDIVTTPGQTIFSPISGKVTRFPYPYAGDLNYTGIEIINSSYKVKIFYMKSTVAIGTQVTKGQAIGVSQNIAAKYSTQMTNHVHIEVYSASGKLLDPTKLF